MAGPNLAVTHVAASQNQKEAAINDMRDRAGDDAVDIDISAGNTAAVTPTSPQSFALGEWNTLAVHYKCAEANGASGGGRRRVILNGVDP